MPVNRLMRYLSRRLRTTTRAAREEYAAFRRLLDHDRRANELIAELEDLYHNGRQVDFAAIQVRHDELHRLLTAMVADLEVLSGRSWGTLAEYIQRLDACARFISPQPAHGRGEPYVLDWQGAAAAPAALVGGKARGLARIHAQLGLPVPRGFVITTNAWQLLVDDNRLTAPIRRGLARIDLEESDSLVEVAADLQQRISRAVVPTPVRQAVAAALAASCPAGGLLAVRSSAVTEDGERSFAGQYRSLLGVKTENVLDAYRQVLASRYAPQALCYRILAGLADEETAMAVAVVEMVDAAAAGVAYSRDPTVGGGEVVVIHGVWGLAEPLVAGEVGGDVFLVRRGPEPVVEAVRPAAKPFRLVPGPAGVQRQAVSPADQQRPCIDEATARTLCRWIMALETFFGVSVDMEWCLDHQGRLSLLQARPLAQQRLAPEAAAAPPAAGEAAGELLLAGGVAASAGIGCGRVRRVSRPAALTGEVAPDTVLVVPAPLPAYARLLPRVAAVVADTGSVVGHLASVAREHGVPMLVGTGNASQVLADGEPVVVDAGRGQVRRWNGEKVANPAAGRRNPFHRRLRFILQFVSPLRLVDPHAPDFRPEGCRSFHDVVRFVHETAMREMFLGGDRRSGKGGAKRLRSDLPLDIYLVDVGGGLETAAGATVTVDAVRCRPLRHLYRGLADPVVDWSGHRHFDWQTFDTVALAGGVVGGSATALASYAVISADYLNLNLRFGYHFIVLDTLASGRQGQDHLLLRFAGGGADFSGRSRRVAFLAGVLQALGLEVTVKGDLLDGRFVGQPPAALAALLEELGRLFGLTRLLDMALDSDTEAAELISAYLARDYRRFRRASGQGAQP